MTQQDVIQAILAWPGLYETAEGRLFQGAPVSEVPTRLREARWRNVSRLDRFDLKHLGLEIVEARYVGGARPKRFCDVVVARDVGPRDSRCGGMARCEAVDYSPGCYGPNVFGADPEVETCFDRVRK